MIASLVLLRLETFQSPFLYALILLSGNSFRRICKRRENLVTFWKLVFNK